MKQFHAWLAASGCETSSMRRSQLLLDNVCREFMASWRVAGLVVTVICALIIPAVKPSPALAQGGPAGVQVALVEERDFVETAPVLGEFLAPTNSLVAARVSGLISKVHVAVGEAVTLNAPLIDLDTELLDIELTSAVAARREAEAGLAVAQTDLRLAEQNFARIDQLRSSPAFSEGRFDELQSQVERARGQIAQAQARISSADVSIARARYNLDNATITAPFSGTVLDVPAQPGEYIAIGNPLVRLLDQQNLEIVADVPAAYVGGLTIGRSVSVMISGRSGYEASVRAVLPQETVTTRTRPVRFMAPFTASTSSTTTTPYAAGQTVSLAIPIAEPRRVLTVPKDALVQGRGGWIVYIDDGGKAAPRQVTLGQAVGDRFEVLNGLQGGESVVVRGNERLRPGQDIMAMPMADSAPEAAQSGANSN